VAANLGRKTRRKPTGSEQSTEWIEASPEILPETIYAGGGPQNCQEKMVDQM
jgi:hypothetical protein